MFKITLILSQGRTVISGKVSSKYRKSVDFKKNLVKMWWVKKKLIEVLHNNEKFSSDEMGISTDLLWCLPFFKSGPPKFLTGFTGNTYLCSLFCLLYLQISIVHCLEISRLHELCFISNVKFLKKLSNRANLFWSLKQHQENY